MVPGSTALVLIDLQHSNVARTLAPYTAQQVVENGARLAQAVRSAGGTVIYVRVLVNEILRLPSDVSIARDPSLPPAPPEAWQIVDEAGLQPGDLVIDKRQWGAFNGTALDQELRRRGIRTLIMAGIATNIGVESTARAAHDLGYALVFAEDAMSSLKAEMHQFSMRHTFPLMGHVRSTAELVATLRNS